MEKNHASEHPKMEENYKNIIKELDQQLNETKKRAERETQALKIIIESKEKEINQLKEVISNRNSVP
jgi:seryl-tRNA(Sec) selenium transferase